MNRTIDISKLDAFFTEYGKYLDPAYSVKALPTDPEYTKHIFEMTDVIMGLADIDHDIFVIVMDQILNGVTNFKEIYNALEDKVVTITDETGASTTSTIKDISAVKMLDFFYSNDQKQSDSRYQWLKDRLDLPGKSFDFKPIGMNIDSTLQSIGFSFGKTLHVAHLKRRENPKSSFGVLSYSIDDKFAASSDDEDFMFTPSISAFDYTTPTTSANVTFYTSISAAEEDYRRVIKANSDHFNNACLNIRSFSHNATFPASTIGLKSDVVGSSIEGAFSNKQWKPSTTIHSFIIPSSSVTLAPDYKISATGTLTDYNVTIDGAIAALVQSLGGATSATPGGTPVEQYLYPVVNPITKTEAFELHNPNNTVAIVSLQTVKYIDDFARIMASVQDTDNKINSTGINTHPVFTAVLAPLQTVIIYHSPNGTAWRQLGFEFGNKETPIDIALTMPLFLNLSPNNFKHWPEYRYVVKSLYGGVSESETDLFTNHIAISAAKDSPMFELYDKIDKGNYKPEGIEAANVKDKASVFGHATLMTALRSYMFTERIGDTYAELGDAVVNHQATSTVASTFNTSIIRFTNDILSNWFHAMAITKYAYFDGIYAPVRAFASDWLLGGINTDGKHASDYEMASLLVDSSIDIIDIMKQYLKCVRTTALSVGDIVKNSGVFKIEKNGTVK